MKIKHIVPLKTKKKVEQFIADWREQLNLTGWAILVEWTQEEHMTQTSGRAAAWVNCDPIYRRANISINEKSFAHTLKCTGRGICIRVCDPRTRARFPC